MYRSNSCTLLLHKVPAAAMNPTKRDYFQKDLQDWCSYTGVQINWPEKFPLRSVLPLRVTLAANCDPALIEKICESFLCNKKFL